METVDKYGVDDFTMGSKFIPEEFFYQYSSNNIAKESIKMTNNDQSTENPLKRQVGGNHYKNFAIQPVEFITQNRLGFLAGSVIKRMCRYNQTSGKGLQDLRKAIHEIELLIQLENWINREKIKT